MLRAAGLRVTANPAHEIYLCEPNPERPSAMATWNAAELDSAAGRPPTHARHEGRPWGS